MSLKEKYNLDFYFKIVNGEKHCICTQKNLNGEDNSHLVILQSLDTNDCQGFISELDRCLISQRNIQEGFTSDPVENQDIRYSYPDVIINDLLTISMIDLKGLLQEWLAFINLTCISALRYYR